MSTTTAGAVEQRTLDLIENALLNLRYEMDEVVRRAAMSPMIREQHDEFPMVCNRRGQMVVGQFGSYIPGVIERLGGDLGPGDVVLFNDPYLSDGSITHTNDWCLVVPIFHAGRHVAFASMFGHMMDVGGKVPGSQVNDADSIWEEGIRIPPVKIVEGGRLNRVALDVILNNCRAPAMNESDLMALIAGCRVAETRVGELCDRFGADAFEAACDALLERTREAVARLVRRYVPEERVTFTDWVDDDGRGNGPFQIVLTLWREGDRCHVDWTGTAAQAPGPINFCVNEGLCKLFFGIYLIMAFDSEILFNDGVHDVFEVTLPEGTILNPRFPAALSNRLNVHVRFFDCMSGALGQASPDLAMAAGYGASPYFVFSGEDDDGDYFQFVELLFGGLPARARGDGLDGHSWWPLFRTTPVEFAESRYPIRVERYEPVLDGGGAGRHRGGAGVEKEYEFLRDGVFSINDDRTLTNPWGVGGGRAGARGSKLLIRADGSRLPLPSKVDTLSVGAGDRLVFRTAGAGGWGDPLERPAELVARDVADRLVSPAGAAEQYGVVVRGDAVDEQATAALRERMRSERGDPPPFDFGPAPERPQPFRRPA